MPLLRRPTRELPPEAFVLTTSIPDDRAAKRRSRGTLIALMLLLVFLAAATWWVYRLADEGVAAQRAAGAAPARTTPAPSTP
jgi:hypothetical protein